MANLKIEEANKTILSVPWYLGKPWYAIDILQNASTQYEAQNIPYYFTNIPYDEDASVLVNQVQYIVFDRIERQAIPNLFSNPDSAYNSASKSENLTALYINDQSSIFWTFFSIGALSIIIVFLIGLTLGILGGERICRRLSTWRNKIKKTDISFECMSERERHLSLAIVEASGVIVTALFTLGALTGAVLQQVRYVYQFIGYMFAYALPFIVSAVIGIFNLYGDKRARRFPDLFDLTVTFFISGWMSFVWLLGLATQYQSVPQNLYYILPISYMAVVFIFASIASFILVFIMNRVTKKLQTKYSSLSSLAYE